MARFSVQYAGHYIADVMKKTVFPGIPHWQD